MIIVDGYRYALETMTSFALIFLAFGVGLDPRQKQVFGPALSPILVRMMIHTTLSSVDSVGRPLPVFDYLYVKYSKTRLFRLE